MLGRSLLVIATALVFHAAFSTYEHVAHFKALGKTEGSLPIDIIIEAFIALLAGILGASLTAPSFKEITWSSEMKYRSIDEMNTRRGFMDYSRKDTRKTHAPS